MTNLGPYKETTDRPNFGHSRALGERGDLGAGTEAAIQVDMDTQTIAAKPVNFRLIHDATGTVLGTSASLGLAMAYHVLAQDRAGDSAWHLSGWGMVRVVEA